MKLGIPKYIKKFLLKMSILMLIFSLCRMVFYIRNAQYFPEAGVKEFFVGMWFDLVTTSLLFFPIIAIELFPNKNRNAKWFKWLLSTITGFIFFSAIFINLTDTEYFAFTSSRSSNSLFTMLSYGSDLRDQLPGYFRDYWYLILLLIVFFTAALYVLRRIYRTHDDSGEIKIWKQTVLFIVAAGFAVFFGRGGFVHKPIRLTEPTKYTEASNLQLVLNSAYTMIQSWGSASLEEKSYMPPHEALALYNPIHQYGERHQIEGQNICIIILESFSIEFIQSLNYDNENWTPFFDELVDSSLVFPNGFANGKKSIDALPSIISSIPKFMTDEFMLSKYATNNFESLPEKLEEIGYSTAFYHGATNGSMNFDAYCAMAGFDKYYGRREYGNDDDFDGTWGIWDEEFLTWSVDRISLMKVPFFSTIFTISSHPPYDLPKKYEQQFSHAKSDMHKVVQYTDLALRKFFEKARKQQWYDNTLFVLTADHTPSSSRSEYLNDHGKMNVPLIFYHPSDTFFRGTNQKVLGHIDIMPTLLDLIGYNEKFFSFGHSAFETANGFTFSEIANKKMLFENAGKNGFGISCPKDNVEAIFEFGDIHQKNNLIKQQSAVAGEMEKRLHAIIQIYNHCLINNQMTVERFTY